MYVYKSLIYMYVCMYVCMYVRTCICITSITCMTFYVHVHVLVGNSYSCNTFYTFN